MQLLFTNSEEGNKLNGFNLIKGNIVKLKINTYPLPSIGWLQTKQIKKSKMMKNINSNSSFILIIVTVLRYMTLIVLYLKQSMRMILCQ